MPCTQLCVKCCKYWKVNRTSSQEPYISQEYKQTAQDTAVLKNTALEGNKGFCKMRKWNPLPVRYSALPIFYNSVRLTSTGRVKKGFWKELVLVLSLEVVRDEGIGNQVEEGNYQVMEWACRATQRLLWTKVAGLM